MMEKAAELAAGRRVDLRAPGARLDARTHEACRRSCCYPDVMLEVPKSAGATCGAGEEQVLDGEQL
jgi:hypothetical protein